ncbi:MAG: MogA/MoaB family molybdenum cofactor biosynthesis protein [Geobacteraceae bacterium]|nr:MogA/MoaB family molybdenum cofactor biosynthesis protein [Geobacteraceae bacterium]NTW81562.1 MogA/MoaB family molybdenum cofactor biosynthesis protein [Geobacteraceae bacterium]
MRVAILTLSDKGSRGERVDESGPALSGWLSKRGASTVQSLIIADEFEQIVAVLTKWADDDVADLILTTGGTGVSPRDTTPEATLQVVSRVIPGLGELMRLKSLDKTPMASLSRAVAGIRNQSLIINLPGSPRGALENLEAVWPTIGHAVEKIRGGQEDCGNRFSKQ